MNIKRRAFLGGLLAAGAAATVPKAEPAHAAVSEDSYATLIDLTKCDGCPDRDTPACVTACRTENAHKFPEPDPDMLKPYWPLFPSMFTGYVKRDYAEHRHPLWQYEKPKKGGQNVH